MGLSCNSNIRHGTAINPFGCTCYFFADVALQIRAHFWRAYTSFFWPHLSVRGEALFLCQFFSDRTPKRQASREVLIFDDSLHNSDRAASYGSSTCHLATAVVGCSVYKDVLVACRSVRLSYFDILAHLFLKRTGGDLAAIEFFLDT